jgi:flagellar biosynthesis GTPase FlhF
MAAFLEKLKNLGASLKRTAESTVKTIAKKTPEAADKTKKIASAVVEKTEEAVSHTKSRLKLYNLNKSAEKRLSELGGFVFELLSKGKTDVYEDSDVKEMIESIKNIKKTIRETEKEIEGLDVGNG